MLVTEVEARAQVTEVSKRRCVITGNPCGTDTWEVNHPCPCVECQAWLVKLDDAQPDQTKCAECKGRGWHVGECHPREECGACLATGLAHPQAHIIELKLDNVAMFEALTRAKNECNELGTRLLTSTNTLRCERDEMIRQRDEAQAKQRVIETRLANAHLVIDAAITHLMETGACDDADPDSDSGSCGNDACTYCAINRTAVAFEKGVQEV